MIPWRQTTRYRLCCFFLLVAITAAAESAGGAWSIQSLEDTGGRLDTGRITQNTRCMELLDGDRSLFVHARASRSVVVYELERPGKLNSASFRHVFDTSPYLGTRDQADSVGHGLFVKRDTLDRMWLWNRTELWEFKLAEPGDVRTAEFAAYRSFEGEITRGHAIHFRQDGLKCYVEDREQATVHQFSLTRPWDIETMRTEG